MHHLLANTQLFSNFAPHELSEIAKHSTFSVIKKQGSALVNWH